MVAPKRKSSKQRKRLRRGSVWKLQVPNLVLCSKCGEYKLQHRVCKACGTYNGREVIIQEDPKAKGKDKKKSS